MLCCSVFPTSGLGRQFDNNYLHNISRVENGSTVYVSINHFSIFINRVFQHLPPTYRITLLSGLEDYGAPVELWSRKGRQGFTPDGDFRDFTRDPRLMRWFPQNYDLQDCNKFPSLITDKCTLSKQDEEELSKKIFPLPIGIDLHTYAGPHDWRQNSFVKEVAKQINMLRESSKPLEQKTDRILVAISCSKVDLSICPLSNRVQLCSLLSELNGENRTSELTFEQEKAGSREVFWERVAANAFVAAPQGRGKDTHRVYEILLLQSIPVVLSSSLNRLYYHYPIAIVNNWEEAFNTTVLVKLKKKIKLRFGENPFNKNVMEKLSLRYWLGRVNQLGDKKDEEKDGTMAFKKE